MNLDTTNRDKALFYIDGHIYTGIEHQVLVQEYIDKMISLNKMSDNYCEDFYFIDKIHDVIFGHIFDKQKCIIIDTYVIDHSFKIDHLIKILNNVFVDYQIFFCNI